MISNPPTLVAPAPHPDLDLSYIQASAVVTRAWQHVGIVLVGCGGTGSWLAPSLARLASQVIAGGKDVSLVFVDPDRIEEGNIPRQNFCAAELGQNKAEALALRYGTAWGLDITAVPSKFSSEQIGAFRLQGGLVLVVGCVDNAAARAYIAEIVHGLNCRERTGNASISTWWLDCGNSDDSGQVLLGSAPHEQDLAGAFDLKGFCTTLPMPAMQRPELLVALPEEAEDTPDKMSCAEIAAVNVQSLMINQAVAAIAADYAMRLLLPGKLGLRKFATYFNLPSGSQRTYYTTREAVAAAISEEISIFDKPVPKPSGGSHG